MKTKTKTTEEQKNKLKWKQLSETGRIRFRGVRFQTPNSVSFGGLTEFRGANSVSSSQPIICVPKRTHRVLRRTHRVCPETQWGSVSSLLRNSTLETVFRHRFLENLGFQKGDVSGQDVCFGPSRPDPGRNARDQDGTRTGRDGPHLGTWMGPKCWKTKHMANLDGTTLGCTRRGSYSAKGRVSAF